MEKIIQDFGTPILLNQRAQIIHLCGTQNNKILKNHKSLSMQFTSTRIFNFYEKKLTFDSVALGKIKVNWFSYRIWSQPFNIVHFNIGFIFEKTIFFLRWVDEAIYNGKICLLFLIREQISTLFGCQLFWDFHGNLEH